MITMRNKFNLNISVNKATKVTHRDGADGGGGCGGLGGRVAAVDQAAVGVGAGACLLPCLDLGLLAGLQPDEGAGVDDAAGDPLVSGVELGIALVHPDLVEPEDLHMTNLVIDF